jgi:vanillate O-demethylase monooxygenase subunit
MSSMLPNAWHMAAWSEEVGDGLLSRRLAGRKRLLFRREDGGVAILDDRCPHRFAPLSMGTREGDVVTCPYHGLSFDSRGQCVRNPFSDKIPAGAKVTAYPTVERGGIVWFWPGDPELADPAGIVDFPFLEATPSNHVLRGYTLMNANYEYGTDNLMDLSHIEFVHKGSFAGAGVIFAGRHEVVQDGDTLHSNWWMPGVPAPSHTRGIYPPEMITDHWLDMRWNAPATMYLQVGATPAGEEREAGIIVDQVHILTPETEGSTHYFWASGSPLPLDVPENDEMFRELFRQAFDMEDKPIIEAAYANLDGRGFWEAKPLFLGVDAGGTRTRRLLESIRARSRDASRAA